VKVLIKQHFVRPCPISLIASHRDTASIRRLLDARSVSNDVRSLLDNQSNDTSGCFYNTFSIPLSQVLVT